MDATMMHVMLDIKDEFKSRGQDTKAIAELIHKDKTVVDRQFSEKNGTQSLLTAYGYAEAAGGRVVFILDDEWERLKAMEAEYPTLKETIRDLDQRLGNMAETAKSMAAQIEAQTKIIERLEKQIDDKDESIRRKEVAISRKDGVIADLLRKAGVIE